MSRIFTAYGLLAIAFAIAVHSPDQPAKDRFNQAAAAVMWPATLLWIVGKTQETPQ